MSKRKKALLILTITLILLGGGLSYIIMSPGTWSEYLIEYINENLLESNDWSLSLVEIDGKLTSDVTLRSVYLRSGDGSVVIFCENVLLNLDLSRILSGKWGIDELAFDNAIVTVRNNKENSIENLSFITDLLENDFSVSTLRMSSATLHLIDESQEPTIETLYTVDLAGEIISGDEALQFEPWDLHITEYSGREKIRLESGIINIGPTFVEGEELYIYWGDDRFVLSGKIDLKPQKQIQGELLVDNLLSARLQDYRVEEFFDTDRVNLRVTFDTDFISGFADAAIHNSYSNKLLARAEVSGKISDGHYTLKKALFELGETEMRGNGTYSDDGQLELNLEITNLNLADVLLIGQKTEIKGHMELSASLKNFEPDEVEVMLDLINSVPGELGYVAAKGGFRYENNRLEIKDSLRFDFDYGSIIATGRMNLTNKQMAVSITARQGNLSALASLLEIGDVTGRVRGTLEASGYLYDPTLSGFLSFENIITQDADLESFSASFLVNSVVSEPYGQFRAVASNGHLREFPLDEAEFDLFFRGDSILVSKAKLQNADYTFQASGQLIGDEKIVIDQMQLAFADEMVTNGNQIVFQHQNNRIELKPAEFRLNDGRVEIAFLMEDEQIVDASLSVVNLNLTGLATALDLQLPIIGDLFAEVALTTTGDQIESAGVIEIMDGRFGDTSFENFTFASDLKDNVLRIKEFKIKDEKKGVAMLSGSVEVRRTDFGKLPFEIDPEGFTKFSGEFKNFQLDLLEEYLPEDVSIDGLISGSLAISGIGKKPEIVFAFEIISPRYDKIIAKNISASGRYTDKRLYFEDLIAYTKGGYYSGGGYLPIDLSISRLPNSRWLKDEPIAMQLSAVTPNLEILTPYLVDVDSVTGDIELSLEIVGTPAHPVRNGKVLIKDGTIYALMLDRPILGVEGSAILKENKFILENLIAKSHISSNTSWGSQLKKTLISGKKAKSSSAHNIRVSGSMDLEEFFWPNLAFLITGKDVYVRTLLGEIEGVADLNLSITGKDTVSIAGDIIPSEAILRMEFVEDPYAASPIEGETITHYKLHFPMENGNVFLQNSQMDAEFEGTMSLYQLGNGPYRYSGELDVRKGKFYYFTDVFDIESGRVVFDPSEFNPQLDFIATTNVSDLQIDVLVSGKLNDPEIVLQANSEEGFYSQGELLELLTIQRRLDGGDPSGGGFGDQSFYIFGKLLENELERNLIRSTPLDEFEIEGSESLMGDSDEGLSVKVGTKMTENVHLSYKQSLSFSEPYEVGVEYKLTPNVSFVISYDEDGQVQVRYRLKRQF